MLKVWRNDVERCMLCQGRQSRQNLGTVRYVLNHNFLQKEFLLFIAVFRVTFQLKASNDSLTLQLCDEVVELI